METPTLLLPAGRSHEVAARRYWLALYRRDLPLAERIVDRCLDTWPVGKVYRRLFETSLILSGMMIGEGRINRQDQNYILHHSMRMLRKTRRRFAPESSNGPLALAFGIASPSHLIGLHMVSDFLQINGWRIHWLATHERGVVKAVVRDLAPRALLLSITLLEGLTTARRLITDLRTGGFGGLVIVGGQAVNITPGALADIGGDLTAENGLLLVKKLRVIDRPSRRA